LAYGQTPKEKREEKKEKGCEKEFERRESNPILQHKEGHTQPRNAAVHHTPRPIPLLTSTPA
jgi:hypothetical protein